MAGVPLSHPRVVALSLVAATVGAAFALTWYDTELGNTLIADPEVPAQWAASWRMGAIFAFTSGSVVGHVCALLAGYLGTRRCSPRDGVLAGAGLGLVNVAASAVVAVFTTTDRGATFGNVDYVDASPGHEPVVLYAMLAVLAMAAILATLGSLVAALPRFRRIALVPLIIGVPVVHLAAIMWLGGPYGIRLLGWT